MSKLYTRELKIEKLLTNGHLLQVTENRYVKQQGEAISVQPWTGPESSRSLRLPDFNIFYI
jgi:hypothetical protein